MVIDVNSNCSRVDAVKASANQLKMRVDQAPHTTPADTAYRKAQSQIQSLDQTVKAGDAQKAETALSTAKSTVNELQTQDTSANTTTFKRGLDVYA